MADSNSTAPRGQSVSLSFPHPDARDDASNALMKAEAIVELVRYSLQAQRLLEDIRSREQQADNERLTSMDPEEARQELVKRMSQPSAPRRYVPGDLSSEAVPNALYLAFEQIKMAQWYIDGREGV